MTKASERLEGCIKARSSNDEGVVGYQ